MENIATLLSVKFASDAKPAIFLKNACVILPLQAITYVKHRRRRRFP